MGNQRSLTNFNLITHGFGCPTVLGVLNIIQRVLSEAIRGLDKDFAPHAAANFQRAQLVPPQANHSNATVNRYLDGSIQLQQSAPYMPTQSLLDKGE